MNKILFLLISLLILISCQNPPKIKITDGELVEGQECFKIETASAVYYYQKEAGGFASIIDNEGKDWVSFRKNENAGYPDGAADQFRGLPNAVFGGEDNGTGHPGFKMCISRIVDDNKILTESLNGNWKWEWIFYDDHAVFNIIRTDTSRGYWLLYEGTPGGSYSPDKYYWGNSKDGMLFTKPDYYKSDIVNGDWQWVYFGSNNSEKIFFIAQKETDTHNDMYGILGNTTKGLDSPDGMTVFGFGRDGIEPLMIQPNKFYIGFYYSQIEDKNDHFEFAEYVEKLIYEN